MQLPTINLNGTAREDLLHSNLLVKRHILGAIEALHQACPHGRDFLPQGSPQAMENLHKALAEHADRLLRLKSVLIEIETIAEHVV